MKKIALFESTGKPEARKWAEFAARTLIGLNTEVYASRELVDYFSIDIKEKVNACSKEEFERLADIVISFGGDGTMLSAARMFIESGLPIMGVNVGRLGFLAEYSVEMIEQSLHALMEGNYRLVDRSVLETNLNGERIYALNDFVIEKKDSSKLITLKAYANGNYIGDYRADGLIVTTPTGSSAYSLSCGGPIIAPYTEVLCLTPISPHSLTLRPLVIPDSSELELKVFSQTGSASLVADGQLERTIRHNDTVVFKKSQASVKLIKPIGSSFFDLLREKLFWAADATANNKTGN